MVGPSPTIIGEYLQGKQPSWEDLVRSLAKLTSDDEVPCSAGFDPDATREACVQDFAAKLKEKEEGCWKLSELFKALASVLPFMKPRWKLVLMPTCPSCCSPHAALQSPPLKGHRSGAGFQVLPAG